MKKIDHATATVDLEFTDGNPGTGTPATRVTSQWLNVLQAELSAIVVAAGDTLDQTGVDRTQVLDAISSLIASGGQMIGGTTTNSGNAYSLAASLASYGTAYTRLFAVNFNAPATGSPTLNINGLGAVTIKDMQGNTLTTGRLPAGPRLLVFDGTDFRALGLANPIVHVREEQSPGTNGGTFTQGAWRTRVLNTVVLNQVTGASLGSNEITLPAGTYELRAKAPAQTVNRNRARIYNVTDASELLLGHTADITQSSNMYADVIGRFILTGTKNIRLEHICQTTNSTIGFGAGGALDSKNEIYSEVFIEKVA